MNNERHNEQCRWLRAAPDGLWATFKLQMAERFSEHIASCPRCQKRLAKVGRVEIALSLLRMQPHTMDLLAKANTSTLKYLKRSTRQMSRAEQLRTAVHGPGRIEKARPVLERLINIAACLFVVLMVRTGLTHKMFEIREQGTKVMENYYARNLDSRLYEDVFGQPPDMNA